MRVRYWASAREAAGCAEETVSLPGPQPVAELVTTLVARRTGEQAAQLSRVLGVCSVLLGDRPEQDRGADVEPGVTVEFLPPFAGG